MLAHTRAANDRLRNIILAEQEGMLTSPQRINCCFDAHLTLSKELVKKYCKNDLKDLQYKEDEIDLIVSPETVVVAMIAILNKRKGSNDMYTAYKPIYKALLDRRLELLQDKVNAAELDENTYIEICKKSRMEYELIFDVYPRLTTIL